MRPVSHEQQTRLRGFTLVELLIVVAILSLLAALLMPTLRRSAQLARRLACAGNQKQQALFMTLYTDNFDGLVWSAELTKQYDNQDADTTNNVGPAWMFFFAQAEPAVKEDRFVWRCPSIQGKKAVYWKTKNDFPHGYWGYRYHYNYSAPVSYGGSSDSWWSNRRDDRPVCYRMSEFSRPEATILFTDSGDDGCNDWHVYSSLTQHGGGYRPSNRHVGPAISFTDRYNRLFAYGGAGNYVFFDGHVATYNPCVVCFNYRSADPDMPDLWSVIKP